MRDGADHHDGARGARVGLLVNPVAGMGGRVGLKGTDGPALDRALALGAEPVAEHRAERALRALARAGDDVRVVVCAPAAMGRAAARRAGLEPALLLAGSGPVARGDEATATTAADTRAAARALREAGVDLVLLAGGDGTARDVVAVLGEDVPVLGVPTGVKMHSGLFAATPELAGEAAAAFVRGDRADVRRVEVVDRDESAGEDRVAVVLHGTALVPRDPARVLGPKATGGREDLLGACARAAEELDPDALTLVGPGTTTAAVLAHLGVEGSLLGVDAVRGGRLVGRDLAERDVLPLVAAADEVHLLTSVIGGQGSLLGRGNQQLSPPVLRRVGRAGLRVVASRAKLAGLDPAVLRVDSGDPAVDALLAGHVRVRVGARETVVMPVRS